MASLLAALRGQAVHSATRSSGVPLNQPISGFDPALFEHALYDLYRELHEGIDPDEAIALDLLQILLRRVARMAKGAPTVPRVPAPFLSLKRHLEDNFPDCMTLAGLARRIPCSVPHLCSEYQTLLWARTHRVRHQAPAALRAYAARRSQPDGHRGRALGRLRRHQPVLAPLP